MKKGYKRLLIFEILIAIVLIINCFFFLFLQGIGICIFLIFLLILFKYLFGFEKIRKNYIKDSMLEVTIFLMVFFIIYYVIGLFIGFTNTMSVYSIMEKFEFIILLSLTVFLKEYLRYMILCKCEFNKFITILTIILFIFLEISGSITQSDFSDSYSIFKFIAMVVMPAISTNVVFSYISKQLGYKPIIYYSIVMGIYPYVLPIIPNVNTYIYSLINLLLPCIFMFIVYRFLKKSEDSEEKDSLYYKSKYAFLGYIPVFIFVILMIYFYSGYFRFWVITIATGSMRPNIQIGDLVVIDKKIDRNNLKIGEVIAYKSSNSIIVHRVHDVIISNNEVFYTTKGDANENVDAIIVSTDMILGRVGKEIPYLGLPTVWLHDMLS